MYAVSSVDDYAFREFFPAPALSLFAGVPQALVLSSSAFDISQQSNVVNVRLIGTQTSAGCGCDGATHGVSPPAENRGVANSASAMTA